MLGICVWHLMHSILQSRCEVSEVRDDQFMEMGAPQLLLKNLNLSIIQMPRLEVLDADTRAS